MRDIVMFPEMTAPLFAGRAKTIRAIERAMAGDRRVLLVTQRRSDAADPGEADLHRIGVIGEILQIIHNVEPTVSLPEEARAPFLQQGTLKVTFQGKGRLRLRKLADGEFLAAEAEQVATTGEQAVLDLAKETLETFASYKRIDLSAPPQAMLGLAWTVSRPGWLADMIAPHLSMPLDEAQALLETIDAGDRLRKVLALMEGGRKAA
jgi:ATP-dependent Lon protease